MGLLRVPGGPGERKRTEPVLATQIRLQPSIALGPLDWLWTQLLLKDVHAAPRGFKEGLGCWIELWTPAKVLGHTELEACPWPWPLVSSCPQS